MSSSLLLHLMWFSNHACPVIACSVWCPATIVYMLALTRWETRAHFKLRWTYITAQILHCGHVSFRENEYFCGNAFMKWTNNLGSIWPWLLLGSSSFFFFYYKKLFPLTCSPYSTCRISAVPSSIGNCCSLIEVLLVLCMIRYLTLDRSNMLEETK